MSNLDYLGFLFVLLSVISWTPCLFQEKRSTKPHEIILMLRFPFLNSVCLSRTIAAKSAAHEDRNAPMFSVGGGLSAEGEHLMPIDINEMNEMFVVEWNARQKKLQIQALGKILKRNLHAAVNRRNSGHFPVAIAHTEAEALEMSKLIEAKLKMRGHRGDSSDTLG